MDRLGKLVAIAVMTVGLLSDPYIFRGMIGDIGHGSRLWRVGLGVADLLLLGAVFLLVFRRLWAKASMFLCFESTVFLLMNLLFVSIDGFDRFTVGYESTETLSLFIILVLMRVVTQYFISRDIAGTRSEPNPTWPR